jgi:hypothetical protein
MVCRHLDMCGEGIVTSEQYTDVCRSEFAAIRRSIEKLDESIRGNGKPGITTRLDRIEQAAKGMAKLTWLIVGGVVSLTVAFFIAKL